MKDIYDKIKHKVKYLIQKKYISEYLWVNVSNYYERLKTDSIKGGIRYG